jgi:hypothetical protein
MDLIKLYLTQSISVAANNLRLNSQQIEIITLLKETLFKSEKTENVIKRMKKITELSTLAIRLDEIYLSLKHEPVDMSKLSDRFKLHSQHLVKDVFLLLNNSNLNNIKVIFEKITSDIKRNREEKLVAEIIDSSETNKNEAKAKNETAEVPEDKNHDFENFEKSVLDPIKEIDSMLKQVGGEGKLPDNFPGYSDVMERNSVLSDKNGFEILAGLHTVVADSIKMISEGKLTREKENIESMRACLIVIAAIIRGKEVDITNYLNKAEQFGSKIKFLKTKKEN